MAIYFFDKNQTLIKIVPESATFEAIQTQELDDESLLKDTLSVTVKGDEKLLNAEYMAVKSYKGNAQTFDMYRIVTDTTPDKSMSFTGMSLAPYELNGHIIQDLRPANHSLSYTLNRVLDGTDWRVGYIDDGLSNVTTTFYYVSAKEALKELQSLVGCEFVFKVEISGQKITDKWIEVYSEMGNRTKKRFNYGTNALTVVRETNKVDIFTALIGRGKGEEVSSGEDNASGQAGYGRKITFEDIEWKKSSGKPLDKPKGQYYLELPQATQVYGIKNIDGTMTARVGIVDFDDEEDKNRLINLTYQQLLVSSRPKVLFKTTVANIGATGIGDTVTIHRHDLNIHYQTRVRKIVRNKLNDNKTQIELGDAVVTASTKQTKRNNATIKNLNNEIDKIKANVTTSQNSADGKNTIFYGSAEPERQRTGDTWYRPHPSIVGETQMLTWNGTAWELVIDTSDLTSVSRAVEDAAEKAEQAVQAAKDADARAGTALEKAGANANLLTTHQNTLNTIKNTTLPDINKSLSDAIGEAQSALSSASSAMDEARKADGKIADYVTKNGLVNGTTVDSKIDTATGAISKKITTVESKIPTEIGGRNYWALAKKPWFSYLTHLGNGVFTNTSTSSAFAFMTMSKLGVDVGEDYTLSFEIKVSDNSIQFSNNQMYVNSLISNATHNKPNLIKDKWVKVFSTFNYSAENTTNSHIYFSSNLPSNNSIEFRNFKLEKGNIATDWTPAPEDNLSQSEFSIFESTYKEDVKGINSTLTELSTKKVDGTTYQNFYDNEYKKTAQGVTDTYNKVNKIIDANGNSTDAFAKAVYERNATKQSADFKKVTDKLVTTTTYNAGVEGINKSISTVQGNLDNLSVGGRNYFTESGNFTNRIGSSWVNNGGGMSLDTSNTYNDFSTIKTVIGAGITYNGFLELDTDTLYTYSVKLKSDKAFSGTGIVPLHYHAGVKEYNEGKINVVDYMTTYSASDIGKFKTLYITFKLTQGATKFRPFIYGGGNGAQLNIAYLKLEQGNKATDWSPAPEDIQSVSDLDDNITAIYNNTSSETSKAINKTLSAYTKDTNFDTKTQSYLTNKQYQTASQIATTLGAYTKTTSLDGTVASYLNNSTSSTAGAINTKLTAYQTKTGLDSSVSSLLSNTNSQTAKGFNSKLTEIEGKIPTQIGGRNLIFNSSNPTDTSNWTTSGYGDLTISTHSFWKNRNENVFILSALRDSELTASSNRFYIKPDTEYTFSMIVFGNSNVKSFDVFSLYRLKGETTPFSGQQSSTFNTPNPSKAVKFTWKFKTPNDDSLESAYIRIDNNGRKNTSISSSLYFTDVKLEEGSIATDWTPAPEDMQSVSDLDANITAIYNNKSSETAKAISRELTNYAKTTDLNGMVTETALSNKKFATASSVSTQLQSYAKSTDLNGLATESYVSSQMTATAKVIRTEVTAVEDKIPTELGGRNIIKDTEGVFKFTKTNASGYTDFFFRNTTVVPDGKEYILSFKAKASAPMVLRSHFYNPNTTTKVETSTGYSVPSASDGTAETRITTEWNYYWIKWSQTETTTPKSVIVARVRDAYNNITLEMKEIKLEKGNVPTDWTPAPEDKADQSQITQLADNINLKVSKTDLISQINVQSGGVLITSGTNKLNVTPTTTYIENGTIKSAMIESLDAGKITTGELDAGKVKVINIDAENITSNKTSFVQSVWNSLESSIRIDGGGLLSTASDKSQVYLQNGVVGARNPSGATIGQIGYAYESSSPWYSMQVSHGSHFQIRMSRGDGELNKQAFYIISGGTESYLNTDNIYLNPSSAGRVRVQGSMTVDGVLRTEGTALLRSKLEYLNGGFIESQSASSNMLIASTNKLIMYSNGTSALEIDSSHAVFRRKISENSDIRLKTNIVDMPIDSLDAIRNMEIKKFDYLDGRLNYYGIIAQQAQQYLPELINTDSEGYLMVDKSAMTYVNMHAIQQLDSRVDDVNDEVAQLKAQVASLQEELAKLKGD